MKKLLLILFLIVLCATWSCLVQKEKLRSLYELQNSVTKIPDDDSLSIQIAPTTEEGNSDAGYKYLIEGDAFSTGIPIEI